MHNTLITTIICHLVIIIVTWSSRGESREGQVSKMRIDEAETCERQYFKFWTMQTLPLFNPEDPLSSSSKSFPFVFITNAIIIIVVIIIVIIIDIVMIIIQFDEHTCIVGQIWLEEDEEQQPPVEQNIVFCI